MAQCTVANILDDVRSYLGDTQKVGGEVFTNAFLLGTSSSGTAGSGSLFGEPYRTMFSRVAGGSKQVQPSIYVVLPANTTVLVPSAYGILDFNAPEMIEERQALSTIAVSSTDTSTPINVTTSAPHGLGSTGSMVEGTLSGVTASGSPPAPCSAPWGHWFVTITGPTTFSLNGSASDGIAGVGGTFVPDSTQAFSEVFPSDLPGALDGQPTQVLGVYQWANGRLQFPGATSPVELRMTYYASGYAPTNPNYTIPIDDCRDFLSTATAANAARGKGWKMVYEDLRNKAYGDPSHPEEQSLLDLFYSRQVLASQAGPSRRQMPFRAHRYRFGTYVLG